MVVDLEVQYALPQDELPDEEKFLQWVKQTLEGRRDDAEVVVRIVGEDESRELNHRYRGKDKPTNVLSFPFEAPPGIETSLLGDLVICAPVVEREAQEQGKAVEDHWAHMIAHGCLHLLGYDHLTDEEASEMESIERDVLAGMGIADPYEHYPDRQN